MPTRKFALALVLAAGLATARPAEKKDSPPLHAESTSSINVTTTADGEQTVEIRNVSYEISGTAVPGRPRDERLILRDTLRSKQVLGDIGTESTVTLEAWPLGQALTLKPLYGLTVEGTDGRVVDNALFVVLRGMEDTRWWSAYKLGSGNHLFDTYVPLVTFSFLSGTPNTYETRYAGLEVPFDDNKDARLRQPTVVAVITYASEDHVIREALLTCDDPEKAKLLRSYEDTAYTLSLLEDADQPTRTLKFRFSENYLSPPEPVEIRVPVRDDDLDLAHAQLPAQLHLTAWRR